jgi:molecular chaperone GrpE
MTDETKKHGSGETHIEDRAAEDAAREAALDDIQADADYAGDGGPENGEALLVLIDGLKGENGELKDRYLRLAADMDNLRRRTEREVKDAKTYAVANFARDMLAVSDNLRRALDAVPAELRESGDGALAGLTEGVEMTERAMLSALERHGVKKQEPQGLKFDPNFHQAMFEVPNADVANNTVVQVVQDGYVIGDRVLRPAMVGVAKGGPRQAEPAPEPEPGAPNEEAEKDA